jgi:acetyl esterase
VSGSGLDRGAKRFLDALNATGRQTVPSVAQLRAAAADLARCAAPAPAAERRDDALGALRLRLYDPPGRKGDTLPGLVYLHGGGLVAGDLDTHDALAASLAAGANCRVIAVDYRRAPEHRFPAARDDAFAAVAAAVDDPGRFGLDPARVGVGGDSAGGQLAALAARAFASRLALQFLICPVMDALARLPSRFELGQGHLLDEATMRVYWDAYRVEGLEASSGEVAPLAHSDFAGLAPARIHVAEFDPLRDEGAAYADALTRAGTPCKLTRHAGLIHHFCGLGAIVPAARAALAEVTADLLDAFAGR